jgi:uncharacterized protein CbrC (UPF0167 family)
MSEPFPFFRYHPNPLETGMVVERDTTCACCEKSRGFVYVGHVYAIKEFDENICPWCIADGSAASKFDASFSDNYPLIKAGLPAAIVEEVHLKTPGYISWQQDSWLSHCNDACEFHGDASTNDISEVTSDTKTEWKREYNLDEQDWRDITDRYEPGGDPAFYKFICRHCKVVLLGWDCS